MPMYVPISATQVEALENTTVQPVTLNPTDHLVVDADGNVSVMTDADFQAAYRPA